jgi:N-acetylneuraminic acid mutarotase
VAPVGHRIIIAGGTVTAGPSDEILSFDTRTRTVSKLGRLPTPLTHASAAAVDGRVVVIGGRRQLNGDQTASILAIDPGTGAESMVGHLPQPLSDAAVVPTRGRIIVAGGDNGNGAQASILALTPRLG